MLKNISSLGKSLSKSEQRSIQGGRPPCYDAPVADVNCVSPWVYFPGCGWMCKTEPTF